MKNYWDSSALIESTVELALRRRLQDEGGFTRPHALSEMFSAFKKAKRLGVRGGRVHDFLHAVAAEKAGADKIITLDENDFNDLTGLKIELV